MRAFAVRAASTALVFTLAILPAQAGPVTVTPDGRVSIAAARVPLGTLMDELARLGSIEILAFNPQARHVPVSVNVQGATFEQAVRTVLIASGATVAVGGLRNGPLRVHIGDVGEALPGQGGGLGIVASGAGGGHRGDGEGNERVEARRQAQAAESAKQAEEAAAPTVDTPGASEAVEVAAVDGQPGYTMVGETVTFHDPTFVPYKNTEKAKAARRAVDVSKIP